LPDATKSLESGLLDDLPLPIVDRDEAMDGTADLIEAMGISHDGTLPNLDFICPAASIIYRRPLFKGLSEREPNSRPIPRYRP